MDPPDSRGGNGRPDPLRIRFPAPSRVAPYNEAGQVWRGQGAIHVWSAGSRIGNYQIEGELGVGGMARVYRAFQVGLERYVAIKVLPRELAFEAELVQRFRRE